MNAQTELSFDSTLAHLGEATVASCFNLIQVVAERSASFSWNDVEDVLPDGIKQTLELSEMRNAPGGLMQGAARRFGYVAVGYVKSNDPKARGRKITLWARRAA